MSIINDALKKAQLSFKKTTPAPAQEKKQEKPDSLTPSNIYEKLYQKRLDQQNPSVAGKVQKEKSTDKKTPPLRSAKRWFKVSATVVIFLLLISGGLFFAARLEPVQEFLQSLNKDRNSSRDHIARYIPKKRVYKPGELVLNGTSLIDGKRVALINDEIYEVGEVVDGKKITSINLNQIELSDNEKIITLKVH
ncbi:MAG: hypothetical protein JW847_04780 [Candidatus Omnitrophica bacterium]|nr:hypothetical protein [Candidatus Omnitrophota bacterium]